MHGKIVQVNGQKRSLHHFTEIDSTNNEAMRLIEQGLLENGLVWAEQQSAGRGQYDRHFYSPAKHGLYLTFVWGSAYPELPPKHATLRVALLAARELESWSSMADFEQQIQIKPINDLFLQGRKIAGILWERFRGHHIVGIGINLFPFDLPEELEGIAGALFSEEFPFPKEDRIFSLWSRLDRDLFTKASPEDELELTQRFLSFFA